MALQVLLELVERYGLSLAFAAVLVEQIGLPLPAYPILIVAGALSVRGDYAPWQVVAVGVAAALLADLAWYAAGRRVGRRILRLMCRISLSPDSCVRQTETIYERWGAPSLALAKFIPGFAAVATAMAGVVGTPMLAFVFFDTIGAALWAGVAVGLGRFFHDAIRDVLDAFEQAGRIGLLALVAAFALFVLVKVFQRQRLLRQLRLARVSVDELRDMLRLGQRPLLVDVRSAAGRRASAIPGSIWLDMHALDEGILALPHGDEVIVYCACPNEASAAAVAKRLLKAGFRRVRPLKGGIDAWIAAGNAVDSGIAEAMPR
jgi:membrane protein DedA with SNARE-associated domain/rhodanese-related sulfurtransferase